MNEISVVQAGYLGHGINIDGEIRERLVVTKVEEEKMARKEAKDED